MPIARFIRKKSQKQTHKTAVNSLLTNSRLERAKKLVKNKYFLFGISAFLIVIILISVIFLLNLKKEEPINDYDFSKGVLSLNTDKSEYVLGETVLFQMGSLDKNGDTKCTSKLQVEITVPNTDRKTILSYEKKQIITTPTCSESNNVTNDPDYISRYTVDVSGEYKILLTNLDTGKKVKSSFTVIKETPQFQIQRSSSSRINSYKNQRYPMVIKVTSKDYFKGQFVEYIPKNFELLWFGNARISENENYKILTWDIMLKKGQSMELSYEYIGPKNSPEFFRFGLAEFISNKVILKEDHAWQISSANNDKN